MKVSYKMGSMTFEAEVSDRKSAFQFVSDLIDVFPDEPCGCCSSKNTRPMVRKSKDYTFYEIACADCNAKLSLGQHKEGGGLFVRRWDKANNPLPNRGWSVYQRDGQNSDRQKQNALPAQQAPASEGGEVPF